jgi:hypothetical protein
VKVKAVCLVLRYQLLLKFRLIIVITIESKYRLPETESWFLSRGIYV